MRLSEVFPSSLLKAEDIGTREVTVRIESYEMAKLGEDTKPILHFVGKDKGLALNKTNAFRIGDVYGDDLDEWCGLSIILYTERVSYQGRMVPAIRVRIPEEARRAAQGPPPVTDDGAPPIDDSDLPF